MSEVEERETILWAEDSLHLWNERRPGFSIFSAALGPIGSMVWGKTPTGDLDLSALAAEGSIEIPLSLINDHSAHKRCDRAMYVGIQYRKPDDTVAEVSFMPKDSLGWSGAPLWVGEIGSARAAFTATPYR